MINLSNVTKKYDSFQLDVSLEVKPGCITGLIGQNGAGKSTTFKLLQGLTRPDSGDIQILGKAPSALSPADRACIGTVLSDSGFSNYLMLKDIASIMSGFYKDFDEKEFKNQCSRFSLPLNKKLKEFSTGMLAKAKLLIALSHKARLLILDEPTSGLDVVAREELLDILRDYMTEGERSILISSHISSDLEGLCDDLYMIHDGKIILHEDTDKLLDNYGILKVTKEQYERIEHRYLLSRKEEAFGYTCLTNERAFYQENYKELTIEKSSIDNVIRIMIRGEKLC